MPGGIKIPCIDWLTCWVAAASMWDVEHMIGAEDG